MAYKKSEAEQHFHKSGESLDNIGIKIIAVIECGLTTKKRVYLVIRKCCGKAERLNHYQINHMRKHKSTLCRKCANHAMKGKKLGPKRPEAPRTKKPKTQHALLAWAHDNFGLKPGD